MNEERGSQTRPGNIRMRSVSGLASRPRPGRTDWVQGLGSGDP